MEVAQCRVGTTHMGSQGGALQLTVGRGSGLGREGIVGDLTHPAPAAALLPGSVLHVVGVQVSTVPLQSERAVHKWRQQTVS